MGNSCLWIEKKSRRGKKTERKERQEKKRRGGSRSCIFPRAFYRPHSIPLKVKRQKEKRGRRQQVLFEPPTLFCVIQPLSSCRCFTSGRWSHSGWTFCPLQFINWKPCYVDTEERERERMHPLYPFVSRNYQPLTVANRVVARENYGQWRI